MRMKNHIDTMDKPLLLTLLPDPLVACEEMWSADETI